MDMRILWTSLILVLPFGALAHAQPVKPARGPQLQVRVPRRAKKVQKRRAGTTELIRTNISSGTPKSILTITHSGASRGKNSDRTVHKAAYKKHTGATVNLLERPGIGSVRVEAARLPASRVVPTGMLRALGIRFTPTRFSDRISNSVTAMGKYRGTFHTTIHQLTSGGALREVGLKLETSADLGLGQTMAAIRGFLPHKFNGAIAKRLRSGQLGALVLGENIFAHFETGTVSLVEYTRETRGWQTTELTLVAPAWIKPTRGPSDN